MSTLKGRLRRFFTKTGLRERQVVKDIVTRCKFQSVPLKMGQQYRGETKVSSRFGNETIVKFGLFTYHCTLRDYHHCMSIEVVLEGEKTSVAILLLNAATRAHIKTIWS